MCEWLSELVSSLPCRHIFLAHIKMAPSLEEPHRLRRSARLASNTMHPVPYGPTGDIGNAPSRRVVHGKRRVHKPSRSAAMRVPRAAPPARAQSVRARAPSTVSADPLAVSADAFITDRAGMLADDETSPPSAVARRRLYESIFGTPRGEGLLYKETIALVWNMRGSGASAADAESRAARLFGMPPRVSDAGGLVEMAGAAARLVQGETNDNGALSSPALEMCGLLIRWLKQPSRRARNRNKALSQGYLWYAESDPRAKESVLRFAAIVAHRAPANGEASMARIKLLANLRWFADALRCTWDDMPPVRSGTPTPMLTEEQRACRTATVDLRARSGFERMTDMLRSVCVLLVPRSELLRAGRGRGLACMRNKRMIWPEWGAVLILDPTTSADAPRMFAAQGDVVYIRKNDDELCYDPHYHDASADFALARKDTVGNFVRVEVP